MKIVKTEIIKNYITQEKITKTEFCKRCQIGIGTYNKIMKNNTNIRLTVLFKIARVINIPVFNMFY